MATDAGFGSLSVGSRIDGLLQGGEGQGKRLGERVMWEVRNLVRTKLMQSALGYGSLGHGKRFEGDIAGRED